MPSSPARKVFVQRAEAVRAVIGTDFAAVSAIGVQLARVLAVVPDGRKRRGLVHEIGPVLFVALMAALAGHSRFAAIARYAANLPQAVRAALGTAHHPYNPGHYLVPCANTFAAVFDAMDAEFLDQLLGAWLQAQLGPYEGLRALSVDGKALRGASAAAGHKQHLVSILEHADETVIAQTQVENKKGEASTLEILLPQIANPTEAVLVGDALFTSRPTEKKLSAAGVHYILPVKGNQPTLFATINTLAWEDAEWQGTLTVKVKGREETRRIKILPAPGGCWPRTVQAILIERRTLGPGYGKGRFIAELFITDLTAEQADATQLATHLRDHWKVEVRHYIRDVTYREDASRVHTNERPRILAALRNLAISLIGHGGHDCVPAGHAFYNRDPQRGLALIGLTI